MLNSQNNTANTIYITSDNYAEAYKELNDELNILYLSSIIPYNNLKLSDLTISDDNKNIHLRVCNIIYSLIKEFETKRKQCAKNIINVNELIRKNKKIEEKISDLIAKNKKIEKEKNTIILTNEKKINNLSSEIKRLKKINSNLSIINKSFKYKDQSQKNLIKKNEMEQEKLKEKLFNSLKCFNKMESKTKKRISVKSTVISDVTITDDNTEIIKISTESYKTFIDEVLKENESLKKSFILMRILLNKVVRKISNAPIIKENKFENYINQPFELTKELYEDGIRNEIKILENMDISQLKGDDKIIDQLKIINKQQEIIKNDNLKIKELMEIQEQFDKIKKKEKSLNEERNEMDREIQKFEIEKLKLKRGMEELQKQKEFWFEKFKMKNDMNIENCKQGSLMEICSEV